MNRACPNHADATTAPQATHRLGARMYCRDCFEHLTREPSPPREAVAVEILRLGVELRAAS